MRSRSSALALLARCELGKVAVVVALPIRESAIKLLLSHTQYDAHLVIENLALARLGLWDQALVKDVKHILADLLELGLNLLAVLADDGNVLVRALGLLFLLDTGDDAPRGTACADHILVGDGEKVALINGELAAHLITQDVSKGLFEGGGGHETLIAPVPAFAGPSVVPSRLPASHVSQYTRPKAAEISISPSCSRPFLQ